MSRKSTLQRISISAPKRSLAKTFAIAIATVGMVAIPVQSAQADPPVQETYISCEDAFGPDSHGPGVEKRVYANKIKLTGHCVNANPDVQGMKQPCSEIGPEWSGQVTVTPSGNVEGNCTLKA